MNAVIKATEVSGVATRMFVGDVQVNEIGDQDGSILSLVRAESGRVLFDEQNPEVKKMFDTLTFLTAKSFGMELDEASVDGTRHHLQDHDILVMAHDRQGIAGFASGFFSNDNLFYLHGIAMAPHAKGRGIGRRMVDLLFKSSGMQGITFTTQNPVMFCLLRSICAVTYPNPNEGIPSRLHGSVVAIMQGRNGALDPATGIVRNLYGRCLYPQLPRSNDAAVNAWFVDALEVSAGQTRHAFSFIGLGSR